MRTPIQENPQAIDLLLAEMQKGLTDRLAWLNHAFGKAQYHVNRDGVSTPVIYLGKNEYSSVMPDGRFGNYSFFDLEPQRTFENWNKNRAGTIKVKFGLVFWFNLEKIYPTSQSRDTEAVKTQILDVLTRRTVTRHGSYELEGLNDDAKTIFQRYFKAGYDEKYLMHPYGAVRIVGTLNYPNT